MWMVTTKGEFAASWFIVCFFAIVFHGIKFFTLVIEDTMHPSVKTTPVNGTKAPSNTSQYNLANYQSQHSPYTDRDVEQQSESSRLVEPEFNENPVQMSVERYFAFRLLHALLSGLNYALALLSMLVAMTYNPSLFMALVIGYAIGDFLFFSRSRLHYNTSGAECH